MKRHPSSYRDPSGFVYRENGKLLRQINPVFFEEYQDIQSAGVYEELFEKKWLIPHKELLRGTDKILLEPEIIPFISYPYEWSFTQYKHAAQLTLRLQLFLLEKGFSLKDASAFNLTFHNGKAVFLDTLSIERYKKDQPWRALKQFSEHFFAPLLLTTKYGSRHLKTLQNHINGADLSEVKQLLTLKEKLSPVIHSHISLLSQTEDTKPNSTNNQNSKEIKLTKESQVKILKVLESYIAKMNLKENTEWSAYYQETNYDEKSFQVKKDLIKDWTGEHSFKRAVDLGGNDGTFGTVLQPDLEQLMVCDIDQSAVDHCYKKFLKKKNVISLVTDLMQPAPPIGFNNTERDSFIDRVIEWQPDLSMSLALIHHLTLTGNVPFEMSAAFFARLSPYLIIEFPDREDSWVQFILESKRDARHLFDFYSLDAFAKAYQKQYTILKKEQITGTHRTLFLLQRK